MAEIKDVTAGPRSTQIRADIDRTRSDIDRTLDALSTRLTGRELAADAWSAARRGATSGANGVWHGARQHPIPVTLIAAGLGWYLYERRRPSYDTHTAYPAEPGVAARTASEIGARAEQAAAGLRESASRASETVSRTASQAAESVRETAATVRERTAQAAESAREQAARLKTSVNESATRLAETTRETTRRAQVQLEHAWDERPLLIGLASLAAGALAGLLLPATHREDELLGGTRDRLVDTARERGRQAVDKGRRMAEVAADAAKSEAERQGLSPQSVIEKVKDVGEEAKAAAEEEARR